MAEKRTPNKGVYLKAQQRGQKKPSSITRQTTTGWLLQIMEAMAIQIQPQRDDLQRNGQQVLGIIIFMMLVCGSEQRLAVKQPYQPIFIAPIKNGSLP
jgi:hypothetical protein